ncbi:hypothetical protein GDO81_014491 [Engystomops pustulosus]|uniref:Uncharacterized protein n=1 Tax=Engystomops pustulosus TaxID=76066 RepID=A0AAV7BAQ7_ENGPU|nr:hypothetical protein GDO81_014491 [Engystomops pustulosus]
MRNLLSSLNSCHPVTCFLQPSSWRTLRRRRSPWILAMD